MARVANKRVLPGFGLSLGFTLDVPVADRPDPAVGGVSEGGDDGAAGILERRDVATRGRILQIDVRRRRCWLPPSMRFFGLLLAWGLTRYTFPGRKIVDALIDLPFALPTAVAGIALTAIYARNGWMGSFLEPLGIKIAFTPAGVLVALIFIGLPFVVRTVQPVLQDLDAEYEEAAACLGATRWQSFVRVVFPTLLPALLTGFALAFARAVGEYGSVIFIAGNIPMVSEITPLIIITKLEQFDYQGATAVAAVMLVMSFVMLLVVNGLQAWTSRRTGRTL